MKKIVALFCGVLFGTGLMLSGLADPAKVIGFLNVSLMLSGEWDPTLLFVMSGGLAVYLPLYLLVVKPRAQAKLGPVFDKCYHLPSKRAIDAPLVIGSALFGLGWGMIGICPGPSIVNLAHLDLPMVLFVVAMIAGAYIGRQMNRTLPLTASSRQ
ncbi:YeeE/YedE family protein [Shewanella algidipiscicola]|uniref:Transporter n=1 Tax=Shewanella algidipiscicola TaxID=614070 RepID=A0ABQ4PIV5_9GAMM|nr:YeeE/YedE family protein [Shewanella algidipiscicola]GIU47312.1 transporter [Shewanella algidipiscicola]